MPKIYDNIENHLINGLNETLEVIKRVGFINCDIRYRMGKELAYDESSASELDNGEGEE